MEPKSTSLSILVVEDEEDSRNILVQILGIKYPGLLFLGASDGRSAIECIAKSHPQIVITDVNLPDKDGIKLCAEIKLMDADIRFILVSAYGTDIIQSKASNSGLRNFRFISKPIEYSCLFAAIEQCVAEIQHG